MLVLSRKNQESVVIGGASGFERVFKVTVLGIKGGKVQLGFDVPVDVPVHRLEVWERIRMNSNEFSRRQLEIEKHDECEPEHFKEERLFASDGTMRAVSEIAVSNIG